ncbi:beta strand repeat-containing protein [Effusibacillus pohliae]|uniref:beta strand repeat-containing protein n=1 Tax=Effusibacillus pohliae TaxID=232270 RepID=UPI00039CCA3D|nr:hypothetical protein [Effusibacillus pohliae]
MTTTVTVYGQAAGLKLSAASNNVVANGKSQDVITATVVDANGNVVSNFNGTVNVAVTTNGAVKLVGSSTTDYSSGVPALFNVKVTNGVATFAVVASSAAGLTDTVSLNGLVSTNQSPIASNVNYPTIAISTVAPAATSLKVTSDIPSVSVNGPTSGNVVNVTAQVQDSTGTNFASAQYVTLTITGPGSFSSSSDVKTLTVYTNAGNGSTGSIPVYATQGVAGTIVVTASAQGLNSGTLNIPTYVTTAPANLKVTSTNGTTSSGVSYTVYTVQLVDANGNLITTGTNAGDAITISDNTSNSNVGGTLQYFGVDANGQPSGSVPLPTNLNNGQAKFAVENTTVGVANPTITVKDTVLNFTATATYTYAVGAPAKVAFGSTVNQTVQAGQSVTFTAQLQDAAGNNVKAAGQNVVFYFNSNTVNATLPNGSSLTGSANGYVATTDANGVATVTVQVPSSATAGQSFQLYANLQGGTQPAAPGPIDSVVAAANYVTALKFGSWAGSTFTAYSWPANNQITAGNNLNNVPVALNNAIGAQAGANDQLKVVTSNPAVIGFNSYDPGKTDSKTVTASSGAAVLPQLQAMQAGTATITVTDLTNPSVPALTVSLTVVQGPVNNGAVGVNGAVIGANNPLTVAADTPVAVTIYNVDMGNNPVPVTATEAHGATSAVFALGDTNGGEFRATPNGARITYVSIPVGQSSTTVYYVNHTAGTYTSGLTATTPNNATGVTVSPASTGPNVGAVDNLTVTLNGANTFNGTLPITISGAVNSPNGTAPVLATTATFTNGTATVPVQLYSATTQNLTVSVAGYTSPAVAVTPVAGALNSATVTYSATTVAATGSLSAPTLSGKDSYGNTVTPSGGSFSVVRKSGTGSGVNIDPTTGALTTNGATSGDVWTVTYTQGAVTATQDITIQ